MIDGKRIPSLVENKLWLGILGKPLDLQTSNMMSSSALTKSVLCLVALHFLIAFVLLDGGINVRLQ
jgi:hypothetical protein